MSFEAIVHDAVWREVPRDDHQAVRAAMTSIASLSEPWRSPQVAPLAGSAFHLHRSSRLRAGRYRVLFILFPDERAIVFTAAFLKRREADYVAAIEKHDARVKACE